MPAIPAGLYPNPARVSNQSISCLALPKDSALDSRHTAHLPKRNDIYGVVSILEDVEVLVWWPEIPLFLDSIRSSEPLHFSASGVMFT